MQERTGIITFHGNPMTLLGPELKNGDKAPSCRVVTTDMQEVDVLDFAGKARILSSVPSLDTGTCNIETRRFDQELGKLQGQGVSLATVSMDLPFAQKRWAAEACIKNVQVLSDYRGARFGAAYGVLIKELYLLTRSIFVIDAGKVIRYVQHVSEVSKEPDYDAVLAAVKTVVAGK
jgi:thiol peroxidase